MQYTPEQQLFLDMICEAKSLLKSDIDFAVFFKDFPCQYIKADYKSMSYYPPMVPIYKDNELLVVKNWIRDIVDDFLPTLMRSMAYYYTYCFHRFKQLAKVPKPYPQERDAILFSCGLNALKGSITTELLPILGEKAICDMISQFTTHKYKIVDTISSNFTKSKALSLSDEDNRRLSIKLQYIAAQTKSHKIDVRFGTRENPFNNINDAVNYINFLESEAIKSDPYLNSELITSDFRYDCTSIDDNWSEQLTGIFKIPWASAETAIIDNGFPKSSFVVTQLIPNNNFLNWINDGAEPQFKPLFSLKPNLSKRRFLYRGQTEEYIVKKTGEPTCVPNAFRSDVEKNPIESRIKSYEFISLITRHPLVQLLGVKGIKIFNEPFLFQLNLAGLAQHYYNKTTLLDLTSDIDVAKFFATNKYSFETDTYTPFSSDEKLGIIYIYDIRYLNDFKKNEKPQLSSIGKQYVFPRSAMQAGFLLDMPKGLNLHECPNVYRIYFKHNNDISNQIAQDSNYGEKYFPLDCLKSTWGTKRCASNEEFTISKKARELYMLLHPHDYGSVEELKNVLTLNGFKIGDNNWPEFPENILSEYYNNSEKIWTDFCSNIYFAGSEGYFMKKALENLPHNPEYRHYFYR